MKRDLDLMRDILVEIDKNCPENILYTNDFLYLNPDSNIISLHIALLADAGAICADECETLGLGYTDYQIYRITNQGYDLLNLMSKSEIWEKFKLQISECTSKTTIATISAILVRLIAQ